MDKANAGDYSVLNDSGHTIINRLNYWSISRRIYKILIVQYSNPSLNKAILFGKKLWSQ